MFTSRRMTLLELKAIIKEMIENDDRWHSRESVDANDLVKKQEKYWARVEAEKKKSDKPGFFASLFNSKSKETIKEGALGDMPSDQELQLALESRGIKISIELLKTFIEKLISQSTEESHNKAVKIMNDLGFDWQ